MNINTIILIALAIILIHPLNAQKPTEKLSVKEKEEKLTTAMSHYINFREDQLAAVKEVNLYTVKEYQEIKKNNKKDPADALEKVKEGSLSKMKLILDETQFNQYSKFLEEWITSKMQKMEKREKGQAVKKHYGKRSREIHFKED